VGTPTAEAAIPEPKIIVKKPPVTEPTVRQKPTPETVAPVITADTLGVLGIGPTAVMRRAGHAIQGLDITKPEDAAEVRNMLTIYKEGRSPSIVQKIDAFLGRPEFQALPAPAPKVEAAPTTTTATTTPAVTPTVETAPTAVTSDQIMDQIRTAENEKLGLLDKAGRAPRKGSEKEKQRNALQEKIDTLRGQFDKVSAEEKRAANKAAQPSAKKTKAAEAPATPAPIKVVKKTEPKKTEPKKVEPKKVIKKAEPKKVEPEKEQPKVESKETKGRGVVTLDKARETVDEAFAQSRLD